MKNIKKASCNNQSIKRFLSPQPSNIPCKRQCKQMDMENKCNTQKGRDICIFSGNPIKQPDEMEKRKNNLKLNTNNNAEDKFDWNSFVRDPGELQESRYPVTLNTFKSMTHSLSIVNCILEDIKIATSLDFINDDLMKERVLKNFFIQFYENPQIRNIYKLETKPCPTFLKKKIMQIPTLEIIEIKDSTTNAATVATANIAPLEAISKTTELRVPAEQSLKTAPDPVSKPAELERVEAQSSKSQKNEIPSQQTNEKSNTLYLSKNMLLMDESFLRRHVSRNTQQIEKLDIILERIYAELLPRKKSAQTKEVKSKPTKVHEISNEVCIDISNSLVEASAVIAKGQRIEQAKQLFLTEYTKKNTLAYALRFHNGLKRRIISAILEMSIDEFKKYTKIHDVPEMYDDPKLLHDCYNYAIKAPQIWPANLYMQLCDIFEYLQTKGVSVDHLEDISPMLLHWTELAVITNFDDIVQWDFYRCKGEKFQQFTQLDVYRKTFYEKCWMHNTWLREVPKLHVETQKELTTGMEVVENDNVSEVAAVNEAPTNVNLVNTTEQTETATKDECTNEMNVDCAKQNGEANSNNTVATNNIANAAHAQDAGAGHLAETNEPILSHNPNAASSVEQAITLKEKENTLPEATVNLQTTTTAVVEVITNSKENAVTSNLEAEAQQRIQAAQKLYFYEVEKSYTLPYLLRLHNGLKRRILHAILNMTYTEFKQYTHIHEAAEIYENNELLQHCYDFVVRKPQVWPVNLYMRLVDLYKFLKIKGLTLTAADLAHVSPKLLHWHDLIETTNYDYLLFWDYYRRSGKKMPKNKTRLNTYRQKFYEKCWLYDSWIWHTPKICDNVLTDDFVAVVVAEDKVNANFEIAVMTHALEERDEETTETETVEGNKTTTEGEEITDNNTINATIESSPVQPIANENVVPHKNVTGSVSTVDAEIQTSQHLLHAACANSSTVSCEKEVPAQNPNPVMLLCKAIKKEKLSPLDKLQFNLTNDEENYECVPVPDDIVDLEGSILTNESQEELLLPLSNSESLGTHDNKLLLSLDSTEGKVAEHTAQCTENMDSESIMEQQPSLEMNNEQTQLMPECIVEMEVEVQSTTTTQQPLPGPVLESNETPLEQPQFETQTKTHSASQTGETCSLQEQQQQEAHIVVQQALTGEQVHVPGFISREVKEELLQEAQQPTDYCTEQHKQKQQMTKQLKSTGTEVATALTRIMEAHKLAQQQKKQHNIKTNAQTTVETQAKQQQEPTVTKPATMEKQQHSQQLQPSQQQRHSQRLQKHLQSQQQPLQKQQSQHQQPTTATERQQEQKQQQQAFTVKIPLPKSQQQRKKQQPQISALKQAKEKGPAAIVQQTVHQQRETVSKAPQTIQQQETVTKPQIIQQQHNASTTIAEGNNTQKRQKSTQPQQKQQTSNEQRATRQQTSIQQQQQSLPTVVIPMSMLQQKKEFADEDQAPQTQQQQIRKSPRTQTSQIIAKLKVPHTKKQLEPQQLAKPSQALHTKIHVQQELQEQDDLDIEKQMEELHQEQQLLPLNAAKASAAQIPPELQQSPQQLTQTALPSLLVQQQQAINNHNENELAENPQMIESMKQNQPMQQQTIVETLNASKPTGLEFLSQQLQQQFSQPQLILQRTSTQINEQVMLRSTGTLSQDSPINLPPFVQLANKQTTNTTKKKTVATKTKTTTRKAAKLSDYVPQLTHVFQPLPVALNTKKAPTLEPTTTVDLPQSNTNVATTSHQQLTPTGEEQFITASNISLSPPTANAMLLTLPATLNATSTSASNASYVYTLSGDSSLFNSSELLKVLESYQLQRSQQQQQLTQSELTLQQQPLTQSEQSLQQQVQQELQFEPIYNQLQVTQQQQSHYQAAIQMSQPLAFVESVKQQEEQEQQQDEEQQQQREQQQQPQQEKQLQQLLLQQQQPQSQIPLLLQQQQQQEQQQLILQQLLQQQQLNPQQPNQTAIQIQQPLLLLDHAEQQQQLQQQQSYQLLLQQPQQHQQTQPIVYQLVDVNQVNNNAQNKDSDAAASKNQMHPSTM
ncbi:LOW QUALITY PROTEIN: uncharacterized protein LOC126763254 [Bactrocera neohumeralis]|uniref:LOW QUALITY PROTEIN: uncharacterized protein LOC126763254 n=1 Tax=Bactrocera neohumeralis TaxID=98809 RepID=UPI0021658B21|nr:LOW QUALITY PROTEIN: uncharacterized protein LOC126763254 [Bactrocera neohumeralis]